MAENKDKKVLNVPNKRELTPNTFDSVEHKEVRLKRNVPNLRFKEFEGEWKRYKVSDLLDFYSTNSLSWDKLEYKSNNIMNLHYGLIHVGLPTMVDLSKDKLPTIIDDYVPRNYELCKEGDIVFADASEDTNEVAKAIEFYSLNGKNVVCGLHTIHGRDNNKTVVGFKGYAFASTSFHHQIRRIAQGTKVFSISTKNFSECYIGIPTKDEQRKIADFLRLIDERIATQNKIIDKLESLIKGISRKLLDEEEGHYVSLENILKERIEKTTINNQYEVLSSTVNGIFIQREYFSREIASLNNVGYKVLRLNEIVLSPQNLWMGNINYKKSFKIGIVSPSYKIFSIADCYDKDFIAALLKTNRALYNYALASEQGASIVRRNLNIEAFKQIVFKLPSYKKQCQIGKTISLLEKSLENNMKLKNSYELQKTYLLRHMFI